VAEVPWRAWRNAPAAAIEFLKADDGMAINLASFDARFPGVAEFDVGPAVTAFSG
jgi:hypothetical protein